MKINASLQDREFKEFLIILIVMIYLSLIIFSGYNISVLSISGLVIMYFINKLPKVIAFFLLLLNETFFYLINLKGMDIRNLIVVVALLLIIIDLPKMVNFKFQFAGYILFIFMLAQIQVLNTYVINKQPIINGFTASKIYFIYLLYFYLVQKVKFNYNIKKSIEKIFISSGTILAFLFIIQHFIYKSKIIFYVDYGERNGARWYTGYNFIIFSMFLSIGMLLKCEEKMKSMRYLIIIAIDLMSVFIVSQTRNFITGIFMSIVILIAIQKKYNKIPVVYLIVTVVGIYTLLIKDNIFVSLYNSIFNEVKSSGGTIGVRFTEIRYFVTEWMKYPIFGVGLYSNNFDLTYFITGLNKAYFLSDVGIVGFLFEFGIIGVLWVVCLISKLIKMIYVVYKEKTEDSYTYIGYLIYLITTIYSSIVFNNFNSIFYFIIFLVLLESDFFKIKTKLE